MPPLITIGVWENEAFIGSIIYGRGAAPNLGRPYGLHKTEVCELLRVALTSHRTPVSRILRISFKLLKERSPGLKLVVSFADPFEGHYGGIYQAGGWIYAGSSSPSKEYKHNGRWLHPREVTSGAFGGKRKISAAEAKLLETRSKPGKHRYLMPLTKPMRVRVSALAQPYPKRVSSSEPSENPSEVGGAAPTLTLHPSSR